MSDEQTEKKIKQEKLERHFPDMNLKPETSCQMIIRRTSDGRDFFNELGLIDEYRTMGFL